MLVGCRGCKVTFESVGIGGMERKVQAGWNISTLAHRCFGSRRLGLHFAADYATFGVRLEILGYDEMND